MQEFLGRVGAELDVFLTSPRTDPARSMPDWSKRVNGELPVRGLGADAVLEELVDLIPYGNRVSDPGFWAFVTAGPTTTPLAAFAAGMVASPSATSFQRLTRWRKCLWIGSPDCAVSAPT